MSSLSGVYPETKSIIFIDYPETLTYLLSRECLDSTDTHDRQTNPNLGNVTHTIACVSM